MRTLLLLWAMARPILTPVSITIYTIGMLIARAMGFSLDIPRAIWGLVALILSVTAAHYINEYTDHETDAITQTTLFSGGSGVANDDGARQLAWVAAWGTLVVALGFALLAWKLGHLSAQAFVLWLVGTTISWFYSMPPIKLAWRGYSEVINALIVGLIIPLYGYTVQTQVIDWRVIVGCIPFTAIVFVLILSTNWADRDADMQVGKKTITTQLTPEQLRRLYVWLAIIGFGVQPLLIGWILPPIVVWSSVPALPFIWWASRRFTRIHSPMPTVYAMLVLLPLQAGAWILAG